MERGYRKIKLSIGGLILFLGIFNIPLEFDIIDSIVSVAWIIVGLSILIGSGKIKEWLKIKGSIL